MLVKKATFRSGGKGRTENRCDVSGAGQSAPPEAYFQGKYIESAADRRGNDRFVPGDTAECCSVSEISISCYFTPLIPAEKSIQIATAPYLVLFQLWPFGILCCVYQTTLRHTRRP